MTRIRPTLTPLAAGLTLSLLGCSLFAVSVAGADPRPRDTMNAADIRLALERLNVVGSVMYVAAHPDDENSGLLAYLSKGRKVRTLYLSLTRGDGGQNLIGNDTGERLGVIRTQELLAARRVDGAEQRFTRALDFGFSKNSDESLALWGHDRILTDVVWAIRRFRPDILITRFPPDSTAGHGHHSASAILAAEAFRAAADSTRFPEQLVPGIRPWQAKRLLWNVFRFGAAGPDNTPGRVRVDIGAYDPLLGRSYSEIAGESRSMHKTQGVGAPQRRGSFTNTFVVQDGEPASKDLFEGVDLTWKRYPGGERVISLVQQAIHDYDPDHPSALIPLLLRIHGVIFALGDDPLLTEKLAEVSELIRSCAGLWVEAIASAPMVSGGASVQVVSTAMPRTASTLDIERVELTEPGLNPQVLDTHTGFREFVANQAISDTFRLTMPRDAQSAQPYWLRRPSPGPWFELEDPLLTGVAENLPSLSVKFYVESSGEHIPIEVPVVYRWVDPVAGERYRSLDLVPPVSLSLDQGAYLFPDLKPRPIEVTARSVDVPVIGDVSLELPAGWKCAPEKAAIRLTPGEADTLVRFVVTPGSNAGSGTVTASIRTDDGRQWKQQRLTLDYPHIPIQTLLPPADAHLVRADLHIAGREIGYVMGSGDVVPEALEQMGFHVTLLDDDIIDRGDLSRFSTIVIGVRAYNTRPRLLARQKRLLDWVAGGGRLVVQYMTPDNALDNRIGPRPLKISRDRVTVEGAPVTVLLPKHSLVTTPNPIGPRDFEGWVQERGLSFAGPWDPAYQAVLSCHDPGEPPRDGGLLYLRYGKGVFIYSGYAWFRQLPAGVPGAWRLFANLVSSGK
ncbi:MAG TPA: PIG-L family deacetylase [Candidatus Sulfotelmatobacter sp.]|nr:PIG-L family deacetylase [Candidatus Sulfotelmatobacter sp.]